MAVSRRIRRLLARRRLRLYVSAGRQPADIFQEVALRSPADFKALTHMGELVLHRLNHQRKAG